ncbi:MAG: hypothetical protein ACKPKO_28080, partial [Candidatus Fonsibacter sp.]
MQDPGITKLAALKVKLEPSPVVEKRDLDVQGFWQYARTLRNCAEVPLVTGGESGPCFVGVLIASSDQIWLRQSEQSGQYGVGEVQ